MLSGLCLALLPAAIAATPLSGTYTVKPDSTGDFVTLCGVSNALEDSGICGDCVFELYGDTISADLYLSSIAGSDSWSITFRPGPEQAPVLPVAILDAWGVDHLRFENLDVRLGRVALVHCDGCRVTRCRIDTWDVAVYLEECSFDTIDGNFIHGTTHPVDWLVCCAEGHDNIIYNNIMDCGDPGGSGAMVILDNEVNTKVLHNTLRQSASGCWATCLLLDHWQDACEAKNNILILAASSYHTNGCVNQMLARCDSVTLDHNCYHVESLGYIGVLGCTNSYDWAGWRALGFEAHGLNADPLVASDSNLHLLPGSPCIGAAVPIPGIETDIDGDPRDSLHPDMGADEAPSFEQEESSWPSDNAPTSAPTVIRGVLRLPPTSSSKSRATSLLDVAGRSVLYLYPGPNNVRYLTPGVYFVRERATASTLKVIITR